MRATFVALPACLMLAACGAFEDANRLGVAASGDGGVRAHFVPCPGEAVTRLALVGNVGAGVQLETGDDEPGDDPDDDEIVLWSARSDGSSVTEFQIGVAPSGFSEELPLEGRPADHGGMGVFVGYRNADGGLASLEIGFGFDQLERDRILTLDDYKDPTTFRRDGEALCAE